MTETPTDAAFDIRSLPFPEALRWLRENGEPAEPRPDVDTASLRRRFPRLADVTVTDVVVTSPHGPQPARVYRDETATASGRALVWVHGGAFIGGYLDMPESNWVALELAARGIPVFAVDYTKCLGDVHYPVPSDDVLAAWKHARAHAVELLGVRRTRLCSAVRVRAARSLPARSRGFGMPEPTFPRDSSASTPPPTPTAGTRERFPTRPRR